jgi:hypothetical protein
MEREIDKILRKMHYAWLFYVTIIPVLGVLLVLVNGGL